MQRCSSAHCPSDQRRVVELAYFGGFTHEQIAEMLGAPLGTVKGRMRLALEKMRASIDPEGGAAVSSDLEHREFTESLGAYALGALPEEETAAVARAPRRAARSAERSSSGCASPSTRCPPRSRRSIRRPS